MRTEAIFAMVLGLGAGALAGCGGNCDPNDLFCTRSDGGVDGGGADGGFVAYKLVSGEYTVTELRNKMDGCMIDTNAQMPIQGSAFTLTNDGMGNVELKGWGKGMVRNNAGMLMLSGSQSAGTCTYNYSTRLEMTLTGDNQFTGVYTEDQTNRLSTCQPAVGMSCRSSWIMDLKKM